MVAGMVEFISMRQYFVAKKNKKFNQVNKSMAGYDILTLLNMYFN